MWYFQVISQSLARQAQGRSVHGCVRQRGWTPRFGSFTEGFQNPVAGVTGALLIASAEVLVWKGKLPRDQGNWSVRIIQKSQILRVKRVHSHYIYWNLQILRITSTWPLKLEKKSLKDLQNSNWAWSELSMFTTSSFFIFKFFIARSSTIPQSQFQVLVWHIPLFHRLDLGGFTSSYQLLSLTGGNILGNLMRIVNVRTSLNGIWVGPNNSWQVLQKRPCP